MLKKLLLAALLLQAPIVFAQSNLYRIKKSKGLFGDRCEQYQTVVKKLPNDAGHGIIVVDRAIYFVIPSLEHFHQIFNKNNDGIAVDIIHKDQYTCDAAPDYSQNSRTNLGFMLAPLYKKDMEANMNFDALNNVIIKCGVIPDQFNPADVECNLMTLQKKALCEYSNNVNMEYGNWDLLDIGLYWDSTQNTNREPASQPLSRTVEFTIPFERNKASFAATDIKQLYDSLALRDYEILEVSVLAFTSVEGSAAHNESLQKERVQSIVDALQAYQKQNIKASTVTVENWQQFAKDVSGTRFEYLKKFSKEDVKEQLSKNKELLKALEPLLDKQRKGVVKLALQHKMSVLDDEPEKLKALFHSSLSESKLEDAIFLQHIIFEKIRDRKLADDFIGQLEIPSHSDNGPLFNNVIAFKWERDNYDLRETILAFESLQNLIPNSSKLKFNLAALKIEAWSEGDTINVNKQTIDSLIRELENSDIHPSLIRRLKINYNLVLIQYLIYEKKFKEKRRLVKDVYYQYSKADLSDDEVFSIAKFLTYYSEFKMATDILYPRITADYVPEDLLFYYLKLTIGKSKNNLNANYKAILQKAVSMNGERYCALFLPKAQGGFSFQLKGTKALNDSYCENCKNSYN